MRTIEDRSNVKAICYIFVLISLLSGCQRYRLDVDSILYQKPESKKYFLPTREDDPRYTEYSVYIDRALTYKGYKKVDSADGADVQISFNYSGKGESGFKSIGVATDVYVKFNVLTIEIDAVNSSNKPLWKTTINCVRRNGLLRQVFPVMIGGALSYLETNHTASFKIYSYHDHIQYISGTRSLGETKGAVNPEI